MNCFWSYLALLPLMLVGWSYFGLPLYLLVLARRRASAAVSNCKIERVAVLIAAYNEANSIDKLLDSLKQQETDVEFKSYLGSDGSDDGTIEKCKAANMADLTLREYTDRRGKLKVLHDIVADPEVRTFDPQIYLFCDAKSALAPNAIQDMVKEFADQTVDCVSCNLSMIGNDGEPEGEGLYWKYEMWLKRQESNLGMVMGCNGACFAIRPQAYVEPSAGILVEDLFITIQPLLKGRQVKLVESAVVTQPACKSMKDEWKRKVRIGAGNFQAMAYCGSLMNPFKGRASLIFWGHKLLRWWTPFLLVLLWCFNVLAILSRDPLATVHFASLTFGALILVASGVCWLFADRLKLPKLVSLPGYFGLMNLGLAAGFFRWIRGTQKVTWERVDRSWQNSKSEAN